MVEDGEDVQIKVALTCAKDNIAPGDDTALPGEKKVSSEVYNFGTGNTQTQAKPIIEEKPVEPTAEEKANLKSMLSILGL